MMQNKQEETRSERLGTMLTNSREFNLANKYFLFLVFRFVKSFVKITQPHPSMRLKASAMYMTRWKIIKLM